MNNSDELKQLTAENSERIRALAAKGIGMDPTQVNDLHRYMWLEAMYEHLVPEPVRTKTELKFQGVLSKQLDSIDEQIAAQEQAQRQATLLQGVPGVLPFPPQR